MRPVSARLAAHQNQTVAGVRGKFAESASVRQSGVRQDMKHMEVWKFPVEKSIEVPIGAEILSLQMQDSRPCLWMLCDTDAPKETRFFLFVGTGHSIEFEGNYIGTLQTSGGLVWHLFEVKK